MADIIVETRGAGCYAVEGVTAAGLALVNDFIAYGPKEGKTDFGCTGIDAFLKAAERAGLEVGTR